MDKDLARFSDKEKIRLFHLLSGGICMHARGLASDLRIPVERRLLQSEAVIEMLHRISEQSEHYYRRDGAQRSDQDLIELLMTLEIKRV